MTGLLIPNYDFNLLKRLKDIKPNKATHKRRP